MTDTIVAHFADRLESSAEQLACYVKENGAYQPRTWSELGDDVFRLTATIRAWGIQPGDRVIHVSENRYEWIVTDLAIQIAGAIHVPVHAPLTGEQIAYQIAHSGARALIVSTPEQAAKLSGLQLPANDLERIVCYEPCAAEIGGLPVEELSQQVAEQISDEGREILEQAAEQIRSEDLATILYTSGTTGDPKGVMLSQRNIASNTDATLQAFGDTAGDLRLCFLPLSHIYARTCDLYVWIRCGSQFALAESRETVLADCKLVQPTLINGVPYFYDKICHYLQSQGLADTPGSLKELLGGRIRICCAGGAALPNHVFDFFQHQRVPILQGYGLTESSPVISASSETHFRRGSVGPAVPDVEVVIADDGEVLARGPNIMMGYYRDEAATNDAVRDGWLYTGDLGRLDEDGFLFITGRKKEIIVTAGGKNISPVMLENLLTQDPLIDQALIIGDDRKYLTALIVPNREALLVAIPGIGLHRHPERALRHERVRGLFEKRIADRLSVVSHYEQVAKFVLLRHPFTVESGEMTPKMSLKRPVILANYADVIEAMYGE